MSANEVHLNDIGTLFIVTVKDGSVAVDISDATVKQIIFKAKRKGTFSKDATFYTDGSDGKLTYTSVEGDLSETGSWQLQAYVETPAGKWHSDIVNFTVYANL